MENKVQRIKISILKLLPALVIILFFYTVFNDVRVMEVNSENIDMLNYYIDKTLIFIDIDENVEKIVYKDRFIGMDECNIIYKNGVVKSYSIGLAYSGEISSYIRTNTNNVILVILAISIPISSIMSSNILSNIKHKQDY